MKKIKKSNIFNETSEKNMHKSISIVIIIFVAAIVPTEGLFGSGRRHRRDSETRWIKTMKEKQSDISIQMKAMEEDEIPYWYFQCQNDYKECIDPAGTESQYTFKKFDTGECNNLPFSVSDCKEICVRDNTKPGGQFTNCHPDETNPVMEICGFFIALYLFFSMIRCVIG